MDHSADNMFESERVRQSQLRWTVALAHEFGMDHDIFADGSLHPSFDIVRQMDQLKRETKHIAMNGIYNTDPDSRKGQRYVSYRDEVSRIVDAMFDEYLLVYHWRSIAIENAHEGDAQLEKRLAIINAIEAKISEHYLDSILEVLPDPERGKREAVSIVGSANKRFVAAMNLSDRNGVDEQNGYTIEPEIRKRLPENSQDPTNVIQLIREHAMLMERRAAQLISGG